MLEIAECPEPKRSILYNYLDEIVFVRIEIDEEADILASKYIKEGVVPSKCYEDALHIALASIHGCGVILSWNYRHIVRVKTELGANEINKLMGYGEVEIASPDSIVGEDDENVD